MHDDKRVGNGWVLALLTALALCLGLAAPVQAASASKSTAATNAGKSGKVQKSANAAKPGKRAVVVKRKVRKSVAKARPSFGQLYGLKATEDELDLKSSVALVVDQDTDQVLFSKNPQAVLPIASITKLMTALVVTEANLPLDEELTVTQADLAATGRRSSKLRLGTQLSRGEMLHLALMSSENRAAHLLGRTYPGGMDRFVSAMNAKARELGMNDTRYVEPTGLSSDNQSNAEDLARLVRAASEHAIIRELSTTQQASIPLGRRVAQFSTTNGLVRNPEWDIGLQKTGYISAAGRCLVMQTQLAGRKLIMVLLDSAGKYSRVGDAERLRHWLAMTPLLPEAMAAVRSAAPAALRAPVGVRPASMVAPSITPDETLRALPIETPVVLPVAAPATLRP